jgi:hypothetical protein
LQERKRPFSNSPKIQKKNFSNSLILDKTKTGNLFPISFGVLDFLFTFAINSYRRKFNNYSKKNPE